MYFLFENDINDANSTKEDASGILSCLNTKSYDYVLQFILITYNTYIACETAELKTKA